MSPRVAKWIVAGLVAVISGLSDVFILGWVDPQKFNTENMWLVLMLAMFYGAKAGVLYVKEHGKELVDSWTDRE